MQLNILVSTTENMRLQYKDLVDITKSIVRTLTIIKVSSFNNR